jgi:hypothetical protein
MHGIMPQDTGTFKHVNEQSVLQLAASCTLASCSAAALHKEYFPKRRIIDALSYQQNTSKDMSIDETVKCKGTLKIRLDYVLRS